MGIERFFNSLKKEFKIDNFVSKKKYDFDYILFDFNSVVHVISQKVNLLLDDLFSLYLSYISSIRESSTSSFFNSIL